MALRLSKLAYFASLVSGVLANLSKPPLQDNLSYLESGLFKNLKPTHSTHDQWGAGWIPQDCKTIADSRGFNPSDIEVFNIHYDDASLVP